jgi:hypothetical protein
MFDAFFCFVSLFGFVFVLGLFRKNALAMAFGRTIHPRRNLTDEELQLDYLSHWTVMLFLQETRPATTGP